MNTPTHMLPRDMQLSNEYRFSKGFIDGYLREEILGHPDTKARYHDGVRRVEEWLQGSYYASKQVRLDQLEGVDLDELVLKILVNVAYCQIPELFTSVTGRLAGALKMSQRADGVITIGELLAVLCPTDLFDIVKADKDASLVVQSRIPLSEQLITYVTQSRYLPPMVCEPDPIHSNFQSPYLTHNDCVILGKANAHTMDTCLDVINIQNRVPLCLNLDFLKSVEEEPTFTFEDQRQAEQWHRFKVQSYELYSLMAKQGNRFWFHHKVDKRGRLYCSGYHLSYQGTGFKKSILDFADKEVVEGVPSL